MTKAERKQLLFRLRQDAQAIAAQYGLSYREIEAEHPRVKSRYGVCYVDGLIKIRLNHARTGQPLRYSSLVDTLCHELAHLRHFNHGPEFKAFFFQLLNWARKHGIYRPQPRGRTDDTELARLAPTPQSSDPYQHLIIPQKNGVPVFVAPEWAQTAAAEQATSIPPWERRLLASGDRPEETPPKKQLNLF